MPDVNEVFRYMCHFAHGVPVVFFRSFQQYFGEFQFCLPYFWFWKQNSMDASFERRVCNLYADEKHSEALNLVLHY